MIINLEGVRISDLSEPLGKFPGNRSCWGSIFVLFPYFVYIAHLTKFTRGSSLLTEKSLFIEIKSGRKY